MKSRADQHIAGPRQHAQRGLFAAVVTGLLGSLLVALPTAPVGATGALSLGSGGSSISVANNSTVTINTALGTASRLVVTGTPNGSEASVAIGVPAGTGTLAIPAGNAQTGITRLTGYPSNFSGNEIGFFGTEAEVNEALAGMTFARTSTSNVTITVSVTTRVAGTAFNPTNGSYYEYVSTAVSWAEARCRAKYTNGTYDSTLSASTTDQCKSSDGQPLTRRTFEGRLGHLATVTSADENAFITTRTGGAQSWVGGTDLVTEGVWQWADGPEAGKTFWVTACGTGKTGACTSAGVDGTVNFNNWNTGEPNDSGSNEDALQLLTGSTGLWNDLPHTSYSLGYVIEYSVTQDLTPTGSVTRTLATVNPANPASVTVADSTDPQATTCSTAGAGFSMSSTYVNAYSGTGLTLSSVCTNLWVTGAVAATGPVTDGQTIVLSGAQGVVEIRDGGASGTLLGTLTFASGIYQPGSAGAASYTENASPVTIAPNALLASASPAQNYSGGSLTVSVNGASADEQLSLPNSGSASTTAGVVSVVNGVVYRGNGVGADAIGQVTASNGSNGQSLVINFSQEFSNGNFSQTAVTVDPNDATINYISGWTIYKGRFYVADSNGNGGTVAAGWARQTDSTYPSNNGSQRDRTSAPNTFSISTQAVGPAGGSDRALQLTTDGASCTAGYCIVRGPYVVSNGAVGLLANDTVSFQWRALAGGDAYDVFGYLVRTTDGTVVELLNETGSSDSGGTSWATKTTVIPAAGTYRFVFVAGSYDFSGGQYLGGSLLLDNVTVTATNPPTVTPSDLQAVTRLVQYSQTGNNPPATRTVTFTTNRGGVTETMSRDISVTPVDDAPTALTAQTITFNGDGVNALSSQTGTLAVTDIDGGVNTFAIQGETPDAQGVTTKTTTYGDLTVNPDGTFSFAPNSTAINALSDGANVTTTVTITASGGATPGTVTGTLTIRAKREPQVTGISPSQVYNLIPTEVTITGVNLANIDQVLFGATPGTGFQVISTNTIYVTAPPNSTLGSVSVVLKDGSTTILTVTNGVTYVALQVPGAPQGLRVTPGDLRLTASFQAPVSGGPVVSYELKATPPAPGTPVIVDCGTPTFGPNNRASCLATGLLADTAYTVEVYAKNAAGPGASATQAGVRTLAPVPVLPAPSAPPQTPSITGTVAPGATGAWREVTVAGQTTLVQQPVTLVTDTGSREVRLEAFVPDVDNNPLRIEAAIAAVASDGSRLPVDTNGVVEFKRGTGAEVSGDGFKPSTEIQIWIRSTPQLLATVPVDANGNFDISVSLPPSLTDGTHTLELLGITPTNDLLVVGVGVKLTTPEPPAPMVPLGSVLMAGDPRVGGVLSCIAPQFSGAVSTWYLWLTVNGERRIGREFGQATPPTLEYTLTAADAGGRVECYAQAVGGNAMGTTGVALASRVGTQDQPSTDVDNGSDTPATITRTPIGRATVVFAPASTRLTSDARAKLRTLALDRADVIRVVGFTRAGSDTSLTVPLSTKRAKAVTMFLKRIGFEGRIVERVGGQRGGTGGARDRRAEITLFRVDRS